MPVAKPCCTAEATRATPLAEVTAVALFAMTEEIVSVCEALF